MSEKYISVWIWLINGIIAVTTILIGNKFLINPENSWTLKINQIPNIKQLNLDADINLRKKGDIQTGRTVSDPLWRIVDKFEMNQLELPPEPPEPEPTVIEDVKPTEPPTLSEAKADLQKRIKINGVFAPIYADAQMLDPAMEIILIPYTRLNPDIKDDIQLSPDHNIYDDLTEIGLQARCVAIYPEGVVFDYTYSKGKFTETFRFLLTFEIEVNVESPFDEEPLVENKNDPNNKTNKRPNLNERNSYKTYKDPTTGYYHPGLDDIEKFNKNFEREISSLGLTTVRDSKTKEPLGIRVSRVPEDSLAKKYDVNRGDIIISINSHSVKSVNDARNWVKNNPNESTYTVRFIRNGVEQTRTISNPNK